MKKAYVVVFVIVALAALVLVVRWRRADHGEEEAAVETEVAVHVGKITRSTLRAYLTAYGVIEAAPSSARPPAGARVAASVPGVIIAVKCVEGQTVKKGDVLFQLDSRAADAAAEKARLANEYAEKTVRRQEKLIEVEGTSQKALQESEQALAAARSDLAAATTQQALLRVQAPLAGVVVHIGARPGDGVDLTTTLAEVVDLDRLVVRAGVPSAELSLVRAGQPAEVTGDGLAEPVTGSVEHVGAEVDAKTGAAPVLVSVPTHSGLRPGQVVTVRIVGSEHRDCLAVPTESVTKNAEGVTVIALVEGAKAVQKPVTEGLRDGGLVEIEGAGLAADLPVVTEGAYALPKETKVRVIGR